LNIPILSEKTSSLCFGLGHTGWRNPDLIGDIHQVANRPKAKKEESVGSRKEPRRKDRRVEIRTG